MSIETGTFEHTVEVYKDGIGILPRERYKEFAHLLARNPRPEDLGRGKLHHMDESEEDEYVDSLRENDIVVGCDIDGELRAGRVGVIQGKELYLTDGVVDPAYRGKELSRKMSNALMDIGREKGCVYVRADISMYNPINLASYFNEGFIAYGASSDYILLVRDINNPDQEAQIMSGETLEIPLSQLKDIGKKFTQGFVAVDIKNVYEGEEGADVGNKAGINPEHWTMIMRKADPSILPWNRTIQ